MMVISKCASSVTTVKIKMPNIHFDVMSQEDRLRFFRISDFAEELNRRLFDVEELMTEVDNTTDQFLVLQGRYQNLVGALQELEDDLNRILEIYGLSR